MKFQSVAASAVISALLCLLPPSLAAAQSSSSGLMSVNSSGLTASVVGIAYNSGYVSAQVIIKNTNSVRVYIEDAQYDSTQSAFLGSGENLGTPESVNGLTRCVDSYAGCVSEPDLITIDKFSYIDPGNILGVSLQYRTQQKPSNPDTISFSVTIMSRFAKSDIDNSPDDVGAVREITLAFPFLSFSQKE